MERVDPVAEVLRGHEPSTKAEAQDREEILAFVSCKPDPFDRLDPEGHLTGSALVADPSLSRIVLLHHRQLDMWLQPGGHADGAETSGLEVALREAREETGLRVAPHPAHPGLLDVDVHEIPASEAMPAHRHLDLRYLLVADPAREPSAPEEEAHEVRWFRLDEALGLDLDPGLERLVGKVHELEAPR